MRDEDTLSELPNSWTHIPIGEVVDLNPQKPSRDAQLNNTDVTFVPMTSVDDVTGTITEPETRRFGEVRKDYTAFCENDVIFAKITPSMQNGKVAIARGLANGLGFGSTEFHVLRPSVAVTPEYIYHYIRQETFRLEAKANMTGSVGQRRVPAKFLRDYKIPLPPLPEQRRIAAKIEELLTKVDAGINELKVAMQRLKQYRIAMLKGAMKGKLTEEWRGKQDQLTSVNEMLQIIQNERENWQNRGWRLKSLEEQEQENLPKLPEEWIWKRLGNICYATSGGTPKRSNKEYFRGDIPWLKSGELNDGIVAETEERITEKGLEESSAKLFPAGTLLIALYGATAGKLGILGIDSATNQAICAIFILSVIEKRFLYWYLFYQRNELLSERFGGAQPNLSQTMLNKQYIPLPPIEEQQKIVEEIDQKLSLIEDSENIIQQNLKRTERLRQSILKRAFEGKLVPQDLNDEPAEKLLGQIKAEKVKQEEKKS